MLILGLKGLNKSSYQFNACHDVDHDKLFTEALNNLVATTSFCRSKINTFIVDISKSKEKESMNSVADA